MTLKKFVGLSIIIILISFDLACSGSKEVAKAKEYIDAGMYDQASILLKHEIQTSPKSAEAHMLLGIAYFGQGSNAQAEQELNTAIVLDSGIKQRASKYLHNAGIMMSKTDKSRANAALGKAKELDPSLEKDESFYFLANVDTTLDGASRAESAKKYLVLFPEGKNKAQAMYEIAENLMTSDRPQAKIYFAQIVSQFPGTEWEKKATKQIAEWKENKVISVPADVLWVDTGINLRKGDKFTIDASGQWSDGGEPIRYWGPNGVGESIPGTVVPSANLDALVGKVGDVMFQVGETYSSVSPSSGTLYLSFNDLPHSYPGNLGTVTVDVSYSSK